MKKILLYVAITAAAILMTSASVNAQEKGDMAAGVNFALGVNGNFTNFGFGAKFQYNVIDPLRLEASFSYFLRSKYITMWDVMVNAHWVFHLGDKFNLYPLAGMGVLGLGIKYPTIYQGWLGLYGSNYSRAYFAIDLGGGVDFKLTESFFLNAETKYMISTVGSWSRFLLSVGAAYKF